MPILNKPDMNYGVWAEGGNIEIPSSEKVEEGWVIEKPLNETMNWLQNRQDRMLQYINERGIPEWDSRTQYPSDAYAARSGVIYKATSPSTDKDPTLNTNIWQIAFVSQADFDNYSDKLNKIESEEGYLGLYVSKANPVMLGSASAPSYNSPDGDSGFLFQDGVAKVRKGLGITAEFSGGTNPKDVVTHEQLTFLLQTFKVGDIYITTTDGNPSVRLGYGTWERFAEGRTLVGISTDISASIPEWTKMNGRVFGTYNETLTLEQMPSHTHEVGEGSTIPTGTGDRLYASGDDKTAAADSYSRSKPSGGDKPHNNVQPSIVVYFWKRIA